MKSPRPGAELVVARAAGGDAVVEEQAAGLEQAPDLGEVIGQARPADVLEHADRGDLVVRLALVEVAVVEQVHAHAPGEPSLGDQLVDVGVLVLAQRDALGAHAVVLGGEQEQAAPAGADVEEAVAFLQHQLGADVLELGGLRLRDRHRRIAEVGARVDPARVEPEGVEVVGDVVVELDLLGVVSGRWRRRERAVSVALRTHASGVGTTLRGRVGSPGMSSAAAAISSRMPPSRSTLPST
jgi:hypothetical protein